MFESLFKKYTWNSIQEQLAQTTEEEVLHVLNSEYLNELDIVPLFSNAASGMLDILAQKAHKITQQRFGKTIQLYTPLYISNECSNNCIYCGFNSDNSIRRITLTFDQVIKEAEEVFNKGFRHLLLLTGEHKKAVPVEYLKDIISHLHEKFSSIGIEVYPMDIEEYTSIVQSGADALTIYQETYNKDVYTKCHQKGRKNDFYWRLNTPDRGGKAGFRKIGIGALLGLSDWRVEGFFTALHAHYLSKKYWKSHIQVSFPRLQNAPGNFEVSNEVSDAHLTQMICALRIILPDAGLVLSTRESDTLRDNLLPLGITVMSAGSKTQPGGHSELDIADNQFYISDQRDPHEIAAMLHKKGYESVWKDWDKHFIVKP